jgi:hypothetical protein
MQQYQQQQQQSKSTDRPLHSAQQAFLRPAPRSATLQKMAQGISAHLQQQDQAPPPIRQASGFSSK